MPLTERAKLFVLHFIGDANLNATQAVIQAHALKNRTSAASQANKYMKDPEVVAAIREAMAKRAERLEMTADDVMRDLATIKNRCMQGEEVYDDEGQPTGEWQFDAASAIKALALYGKQLGMFGDRVDVTHHEPLIVELPMEGKVITVTSGET
jgi:phage terminase small subunit